MRSILPPKAWALLGPACALFLGLVCFQRSCSAESSSPIATPPTFTTRFTSAFSRSGTRIAGRSGTRDRTRASRCSACRWLPCSIPARSSTRVLAYPWAVRLYTVVHVVVAWAGMFVLGRDLAAVHHRRRPRRAGYAFGAPVLFQYCNIIYLVGAAWVPWGFLALELLLGRQRRCGTARPGGGAGPAGARGRSRGGLSDPPLRRRLCAGACRAGPCRTCGQPGSPADARWWCSALLFVWVGLTLAVALVAPRIPAAAAWLPRGVHLRALGWGLWPVWRASGPGGDAGRRRGSGRCSRRWPAPPPWPPH